MARRRQGLLEEALRVEHALAVVDAGPDQAHGRVDVPIRRRAAQRLDARDDVLDRRPAGVTLSTQNEDGVEVRQDGQISSDLVRRVARLSTESLPDVERRSEENGGRSRKIPAPLVDDPGEIPYQRSEWLVVRRDRLGLLLLQLVEHDICTCPLRTAAEDQSQVHPDIAADLSSPSLLSCRCGESLWLVGLCSDEMSSSPARAGRSTIT